MFSPVKAVFLMHGYENPCLCFPGNCDGPCLFFEISIGEKGGKTLAD